ncbi:hypothetical protein [Streptomyces sp. NBC_00059]|uniref:hypothetical protein n=1 Tax=Streptomyces sp. NBC_00059 TaxID=2975635 RepID=UPI00224F4D18|nr:hypothetical protein [Streptomyces sp. NBC_00059]MCX5411740.1 hypothetical protein [Streptomyces sp. NBC_00059]
MGHSGHMDRLPRTGALIAAALVAALTLTACGSGDDSDGGPSAGSGAARSTAPADGGADDGTDSAQAAALEGTWAGESDGSPVALSVSSGKVGLVADQHVCGGEVKDMGEVTLVLKCMDGNTDRAMGTVKSNDGKKLVVSWEAGGEETLTRAPSGTPAPGLPELPSP